jgi:membrane glycosyltransferase
MRTALENVRMLAARRAAYAVLAIAFALLPVCLLALALGAGGWTAWEVIAFLSLAVTAPWVGNLAASSLIGALVLIASRDTLAAVWPGVARIEGVPRNRTALLLCLRNEDTEAALGRLAPLLDGLAAAGAGDRFALFVLSDTPAGPHAEAEARAVAAFRAARTAPPAVHYRRREANTGFKAGNVMEWVRHGSAGFEAMITLDADSAMTAEAVLELARLAEANPKAALIQSLIVARPALVPFPRLFQFGMRHGMRVYAAGIAWWQGPDGPYWGHNAILRIAPFAAHAELPTLPGGQAILSHDQVEAALLRGAGYEVRLDPRETGSTEVNPPSLLPFLVRDIRWMAGNLQYLALLGLPQFTAVGRLNLVYAILLFASAPLALVAAAALLGNALSPDPAAAVDRGLGLAATLAWLGCYFSHKLLGVLQAALDPAVRATYGGGARLALGAAVEFAHGLALETIRAVNQTGGMVALALGRRIGWAPQAREERGIAWGEAARGLWWHSLVGVAALAGFAAAGLVPFLWALPFLGGLALAIPLCVVTSDPALGRLLARRGIASIPEENGCRWPHSPAV